MVWTSVYVAAAAVSKFGVNSHTSRKSFAASAVAGVVNSSSICRMNMPGDPEGAGTKPSMSTGMM